MTDEELRVRAIQELEFYKKDDTFMLADITVDLAIKALEQMPVTTTTGGEGVIYYPQVEGVTPTVVDVGKQEPCEDAISREDALMCLTGEIKDTDTIETIIARSARRIRKLPSVNLQPCEDAIDRAEAIKIASGYCHPANVAKELAKLPPVTPQPKTGHWEQYGNFWEDKFKCSECGKEQPKILCGEQIIGHWSDYCPNCGCRMVEPQERSDKG